MSRITAADGTSLYVKDWGQGRPVVLIHGWPLSSDAWEYQAVPLAEAGYRVVAYDRRGFGRSDQPWTGYDYDTLADDLATVMRELGLSDATLAGFSMGGGEVARYMSRHEGRGVRQAIFVSSVAPGLLKSEANPHGATGDVFDGMKDGIRKDRAQFFKDFFPSFYGNGLMSGGASDGILHWSWKMAMQASLKATLDCVDAFGRTDFAADMGAINVPVLAIHGTKDATVPIGATAHRVAKLVKGAELIEYDGGAHGIPATHAVKLAADMKRFLAGPIA
ncbi:alpha/beta fold hydrolase [Paracoccus sp. S-4012]|uniref:alpha/beta fold hydrolase n=1 Tax=Paracoccus sp. S-4012 TaxID=2665648 RepID=UPI0012AFD73E|nr:alpha/beta hydrolase [Paracoccus sp. S-4012]MRX49103.1 alpha/beta fold hydrolase [Paracoccus sp. S-4012]